jgi:GH15 family glucan-1,4-alpha-glucosidase
MGEILDPSTEQSYPAIAGYAIIGDCRSAALISSAGSIDWLCWPRFDSASVFAALLDRRRGGRFQIAPAAVTAVTRRYVEQTNVLETTFETSTGTLRLTDVMPVADERTKSRELWPEHEILRRVEVVAGEAEVIVYYEPRLDFARARARMVERAHNTFQTEHGPAVLMLRSEIPLQLSPDGVSVSGKTIMRAGSRAFLSVSFTKGAPAVLPALGDRAQELIEGSIEWWRQWASQCTYDWHYRDAVIRSALTLKLLTYAPSGAIVAAATTSLPEQIGGVRNWDYRFCWLRDAALTLRALLDIGFHVEAEAFLSWMMHATRLTQPRLQVLYDIYGRSDVPERTLDHLEGYARSRPVRVGNRAAGQMQLDVYGEVIEAAYGFVMRGGTLDRTTAATLVALGQTVCQTWTMPDEGIWEPRTSRRHNTHSKALCWVALDRLVRLEAAGHIKTRGNRFSQERDRIREAIERDGWSEAAGSYVAAFGHTAVDASLLRLALSGYADPQSARMKATFARIRDDLSAGDGLLYRYRTGDGLPAGEGAFGICSFWGAEARALEGRHAEARRWFEALLRYTNDLGLLSEEIDPSSKALLGNFPQAFSHVGLINTALTLADTAGDSQARQATASTKDRHV